MPGRILGVPPAAVHQHVLHGEEGLVGRRPGIQAAGREDPSLEQLNHTVDQERATGECEDRCRDEQRQKQYDGPSGHLRTGAAFALEDPECLPGHSGRKQPGTQHGQGAEHEHPQQRLGPWHQSVAPVDLAKQPHQGNERDQQEEPPRQSPRVPRLHGCGSSRGSQTVIGPAVLERYAALSAVQTGGDRQK